MQQDTNLKQKESNIKDTRVVQCIVVEYIEGDGSHEEDPKRRCRKVFTLDGSLIAQNDPLMSYKANRQAQAYEYKEENGEWNDVPTGIDYEAMLSVLEGVHNRTVNFMQALFQIANNTYDANSATSLAIQAFMKVIHDEVQDFDTSKSIEELVKTTKITDEEYKDLVEYLGQFLEGELNAEEKEKVLSYAAEYRKLRKVNYYPNKPICLGLEILNDGRID